MRASADPRRCGGFSLLEMLVALAILALVVAGLMNLAGESTRTAVRMQERIFAGIVADNLAAEARIVERSQVAGPARGEEALADRRWRWERTATTTGSGEQSLLRVDITVYGADGGEAGHAWVFR